MHQSSGDKPERSRATAWGVWADLRLIRSVKCHGDIGNGTGVLIGFKDRRQRIVPGAEDPAEVLPDSEPTMYFVLSPEERRKLEQELLMISAREADEGG